MSRGPDGYYKCAPHISPRSESYLTESGRMAMAPFDGILWSPGTYVPLRLTRVLQRDREQTEEYNRLMTELKPKVETGNRSPQMTVLEARTDFLRSMQSPAASKREKEREMILLTRRPGTIVNSRMLPPVESRSDHQ